MITENLLTSHFIAPSVNACIVAAAEKIEGSTCLTFNIDYGAGAALDKQPAMRQNDHDGYGYGFERNGTIYIQDLYVFLFVLSTLF